MNEPVTVTVESFRVLSSVSSCAKAGRAVVSARADAPSTNRVVNLIWFPPFIPVMTPPVYPDVFLTVTNNSDDLTQR